MPKVEVELEEQDEADHCHGAVTERFVRHGVIVIVIFPLAVLGHCAVGEEQAKHWLPQSKAESAGRI